MTARARRRKRIAAARAGHPPASADPTCRRRRWRSGGAGQLGEAEELAAPVIARHALRQPPGVGEGEAVQPRVAAQQLAVGGDRGGEGGVAGRRPGIGDQAGADRLLDQPRLVLAGQFVAQPKMRQLAALAAARRRPPVGVERALGQPAAGLAGTIS